MIYGGGKTIYGDTIKITIFVNQFKDLSQKKGPSPKRFKRPITYVRVHIHGLGLDALLLILSLISRWQCIRGLLTAAVDTQGPRGAPPVAAGTQGPSRHGRRAGGPPSNCELARSQRQRILWCSWRSDRAALHTRVVDRGAREVQRWCCTGEAPESRFFLLFYRFLEMGIIATSVNA